MSEHQELRPHGPSPEQQKVIDSWGQGMAVIAGAGSGKTTTLVTKCVELLRRKPDAKFAAVSFTEKSANDLRAKLSLRLAEEFGGGGNVLAGHWVTTIHGLCGSILRENPRKAGFDGEETMLAEAETQLLWEQAIEALWLDDLPGEIAESLEALLNRESRSSILELLWRVKDLAGFGALDSLDGTEDGSSRALARVTRFVLDRYERMKRRRGGLDFSDLEKGAEQALKSESVRRAFHERFDLVLVDEFQDTNPLQAKIIWQFVKPDASNLCVVGDPKQSIYRFRDADVSVFEEFCSRLPVNLSLTWNFRSRPGIIDYANQICGPAFEASGMRYEALTAKRDTHERLEPVTRLEVRTPEDLGRWVRAEQEKGIALHEMALLLRKIRGNERWLKALTSAGIPIAVGSGGLFWEDPRVRELVALLKWWDNPGNSLSAAVFLRAPWLGIPDVTIDEWIKQDPTLRKPFLASSHPIALALRELEGRVIRPAELVLGVLVSDEAERELGAPLLGLWHRLEELSSRGLDFHRVVREVSESVDESRRERDVPPPRNQGQLCVLTLHGSKGLEFDHVLLLDFGGKPQRANSPLLFWDRERGAYFGARTSDGTRDDKGPLEVSWRELEKKKNLAESKRLFYVALTRARERLVLVCPEDGALEEVPSREDAFAKDHWRAWIECMGIALPLSPVAAAADLAPRVGQALATSGVAKRKLSPTRLQRPRHSVTEWNMLSRCARAYEWTYVRPRVVAEGIPEVGHFTGARIASSSDEEISQKELGTRVHACLERGDFDGLTRLEQEVGRDRFVSEPVMSWALSSAWMAPPNPSDGRDVWTELSFELPVDGEVLVGSMDRLVLSRRDGVSRYSVVDFKVTAKPKSVDALLEAYRTQLDLYAWALEKLHGRADDMTAEALLVNISAAKIQAVQVPLRQLRVEELASKASAIIDGSEGEPSPGPLCQVCEFRRSCSAAQ